MCDNSFFDTFLKFHVIHTMCVRVFFLCDKDTKLCDTAFYSLKLMESIENENFRFYIKTQSKLGKQMIEIFNDLKAVLNDQTPLCSLKMVGNRSKMTPVQAAKLQELPKTKLKLFV